MLLLSLLAPAASAADYTCDGYDDLLVGAPYEEVSGKGYAGALHVIRGGSAGLTATGDGFFHQDSAGVSDSPESSENFSFSLGSGDFNGDGCDEALVGVPKEYSSSIQGGGVHRLRFSATSSSISVSSGTLYTQDLSGLSDSTESGDSFGWAAVAADFNGDGYDDVVIGGPGEDWSGLTDAGYVQELLGYSGGLTATGASWVHQDAAGALGTAESGDRWGEVLAAGDFDGDGYADLAVGAPAEDWGGSDEGAVQILYGSSSGVSTSGDQLWALGVDGADGSSDGGEQCGAALAVGDFDGDGYDDLAIGCPGDAEAGPSRSGSVLVLYGSSGGLSSAGNDLLHQDVGGILGSAESNDALGTRLAAGDFDGDGYDDLAAGVPYEDYGAADDGVVQVLFGSVDGVTDAGDVLLYQDAGSSVHGTPASSDYFGFALAVGDYDADGYDDLAVGSPYDDEAGATNAGLVNVFYGSSSGPSTSGDQMFHQDTSGIEDTVAIYEYVGYSLH